MSWWSTPITVTYGQIVAGCLWYLLFDVTWDVAKRVFGPVLREIFR